jgi:hypothetical protein
MAYHRADDRQRGIGGAGAFLAQMSDTDLLRFLRRLPMVAGMEDGTVTVSDLVYEMRLWGYVKSAWAQVNGQPGVPGRIKHVIGRLCARGAPVLERDTGERRRLPRENQPPVVPRSLHVRRACPDSGRMCLDLRIPIPGTQRSWLNIVRLDSTESFIGRHRLFRTAKQDEKEVGWASSSVTHGSAAGRSRWTSRSKPWSVPE